MRKLVFFLIAGGIGFLVDTGVLFGVLHYTALGPYIGRALAIAAAMSCTWMINRRFTFDASGRHIVAEGARYGSVGLTSALINYGCYSALLLTIPSISPFLALIFASAFATFFSYMGYSRFVFGGRAVEVEPLEATSQSNEPQDQA